MVKSALDFLVVQRGGPNVCKCQLGMGRQKHGGYGERWDAEDRLNDADAAGLAEMRSIGKIMAMILCCFWPSAPGLVRRSLPGAFCGQTQNWAIYRSGEKTLNIMRVMVLEKQIVFHGRAGGKG